MYSSFGKSINVNVVDRNVTLCSFHVAGAFLNCSPTK